MTRMPTDRPWQVLICEDHPLYGRSCQAALEREPDFSTPRLVTTAEEALEIWERSKGGYDLLIADVELPGRDGVWLITKVTEHTPGTRVLVISGQADDDQLLACLDAGASGFVSKAIDTEEFVAKVRASIEGHDVFDESSASRLIAMLRAEPAPSLLSDRELEILRYVAEGCTTAEIGERVFLSPNTVKDHLREMFKKLGVHDRAAAVAAGFRLKILS